MSISICIPTYNRLPRLKCLLDSIFNGFNDYPYEVVIADGGSKDGTIEYLRSLDNVTLIEMGKLTGSIKAYNSCFKIAKYEYIFWPADDFVLVPKVLAEACQLMDRHKEIAIVAPKMLEPTFSNLPGVELTLKFLVLSKTHIFRTSALREINYLDENYRTYAIDDDSCLSLLKLGYTMIFTREVGAIHNRVEDEIWTINQRIKEKESQQEMDYFWGKWAGVYAKLDEYVSSNPARKYKSIFFKHVCDFIFARLAKPAAPESNLSTPRWYDYLLERCVVFKAKGYDHLKDFYMAQKLPQEVLTKIK
ncbi:glycosyltransferase family 2 protein [Chloroflexota bacterium]